ncbi:MAG: hypothetical protein AAF743_10985 [Planctomycetota bacterium]
MTAITPFRRYLVYAVLLVGVGGHAFCVLTKRDVWPFARYAMYSGTAVRDTYGRYAVFGVDTEGVERELTDAELPVSRGTLHTNFLRQEMGHYELDTEAVLGECLAWHEQARLSGRHDAPQLAALRMVRLEWDVLDDASNKDTPRREVRFETLAKVDADE